MKLKASINMTIPDWKRYQEEVSRKIAMRAYRLKENQHKLFKQAVWRELVQMRREMVEQGYDLWWNLSWLHQKRPILGL